METQPQGQNPRLIDIRKMIKYCAEKGIDPHDLSDDEVESFYHYPFGNGD